MADYGKAALNEIKNTNVELSKTSKQENNLQMLKTLQSKGVEKQ